MALALMILTYIVGGAGIYLSFGRMGTESGYLELLALTTVGFVGVISFVRHVIFHRSDARRMGWETDRPDWMFEVGFANLAFGFMGILAPLAHWGGKALVLIILGYAVYLFQAAVLHFYRFLTDRPRCFMRFWRSVLPAILYSGMMAWLAIAAIGSPVFGP